MTRSSMNRSYTISLMVLPVLVLLATATVRAQEETWRAGGFGGATVGLSTGDLSDLPGAPTCAPAPYTGSTGMGFALGGLGGMPLGDRLSGSVRLLYTSQGSRLTVDEEETVDDNGGIATGIFRHTVESSIATLWFEPSVEYAVLKGLRLRGGVGVGVTLATNYTQGEEVVSPATVRYAENNLRSRTFSSGELPGASSVGGAITLGVGYEVPLNAGGTLVAVPEASIALALTPVIADRGWRSHTLRAGIAIEHVARTESALPPPPLPDTATTPPPVSKPQLTASLAVEAVTRDGRATPLSDVTVERLAVENSAALLNYLFFDSASSTLPPRYHRISAVEADSFSMRQLSGETLELYTDLLNIIGRRMRDNPSATITLVGCNTNVDAERNNLQLSRARAESVRDYLQRVWRIAPGRMKVTARNLPEIASRTDTSDGRAENRRVEILSETWEIVEPILFEDTLLRPSIDAIRFRPEATAEAGVDTWRLEVQQGGRTIKEFAGSGAVPSALDWQIRNGESSAITSAEPLTYTLRVSDRAGERVETDRGERRVAIDDHLATRRLEKYDLIIFPYNSSEITAAHRRIASTIRSRLRPDSRVSITGYADRSGEVDYNRQLSLARARALARELGVSESNAMGLGSTQLLYPNDTPEGRYYCRTVNVLVEVRTE